MAKLKAFSLFDSLIAITISAIVLGALSFGYGKLMESENPLSYYQAKEEITKIHHNTLVSKAYISQVYDREVYSINQSFEAYQGRQDLWQVTYSVSVQSKIMYTDKRLVLNEE